MHATRNSPEQNRTGQGNSSSSSKSHRVVEEGRVFRRLHRFHRPGCYCSEQLRAHSLLTEDSRGLVHSGPLGAARAVWTTLLKMKSVPKSQSLRLSNELTSEFWVKVWGGKRGVTAFGPFRCILFQQPTQVSGCVRDGPQLKLKGLHVQ